MTFCIVSFIAAVSGLNSFIQRWRKNGGTFSVVNSTVVINVSYRVVTGKDDRFPRFSVVKTLSNCSANSYAVVLWSLMISPAHYLQIDNIRSQ